MSKTKATARTPSPQKRDKQTAVAGETNQTTLFIGMALDMSWRLAIAILVPTIGGFELDQKFNTTPTLTIIGFVVAMAGMAFVMRQTLQATNNIQIPKKDNRS